MNPSRAAGDARCAAVAGASAVAPPARAMTTPGRVGLAVVLAVYLGHASWFRAYVNDDAYITFRYSRNLASGQGPYFNPGEHVEGYTNFLLMLLMTPVFAIGGEAAVAPMAKGLGVACGGMCVVLAFALARRLAIAGRMESDDRTAPCDVARMKEWKAAADLCGVAAAGIVAVCPGFALNSMSALETQLFGVCLAAGVWLAMRSDQSARWCGSGVAFALVVLARPEGILLFAVFTLVRALVSQRCGLRRDVLIVGLVFFGHVAFRYAAYDHEWLPNTYYAKAGGFFAMSAWQYVRDGAIVPLLGLHFPIGGDEVFIPLGLAVGVIGWWKWRRAWRLAAPMIAVGVCGVLLPFITGTDWMLGGRAVVPFLPYTAAMVAVGWCGLMSRPTLRPAWVGSALALPAVAMLWFAQSDVRTEFHDHITTRARGYATGHTALATWLRNGAAAPGDTVALMDTGIVGYLCPQQRILDITGLTDRFIARSPGMFLAKDYDVGYVLNQRPKFIVLVMTAPTTDCDAPPPPDARFEPWTPIEGKLLSHPDFRRWYARARPAGQAASRWTSDLARRLGAERVFEHSHPGAYYLLAVFRRQDDGSPASGRPLP